MKEIACHEDSNARDWITMWCPECGTICGSFESVSGPQDYHWEFPKMASLPEVGAALSLMRDRNKG